MVVKGTWGDKVVDGLQYSYFFLIDRGGLETRDYMMSRNHWGSKRRIQAKGTAALLMDRETKSSPGSRAAVDRSIRAAGAIAKLCQG